MAEGSGTTEQNTKENPKRFSFERWKYTLAGNFWGCLFGLCWGFISQKWVAGNAFLNKHFVTGADLSANIYVPRVVGMSTMLGGVIGGVIDIIRDFRRPLEGTTPPVQPGAMLVSMELPTEAAPDKSNKLQEMLARKEAAKTTAPSGPSR